jgi:hypothetical protein
MKEMICETLVFDPSKMFWLEESRNRWSVVLGPG